MQQMSFGDFIKARFGPKWVYAARTSPRIERQYPGSVVITPKQQRQLARDYKALWGRQNDPVAWQALLALRVMLTDYRSEGCPDKNCGVCQRSKTAEALARSAIAALTA